MQNFHIQSRKEGVGPLENYALETDTGEKNNK